MTIEFLAGGSKEFGHIDGNFDKSYSVKSFDFRHRTDLMGVFGMVNEENDSILTLGFFVNDCPVRSLLDFESRHKTTKLEKLEHMAEGFAL